MGGQPSSAWTPDTRFGTWFQGTEVWRRYVVSQALDEFDRLLRGRALGARVVLDAGCGSGTALRELTRRFRPDRLVAVDIDARQLEVARREAQACGAGCEVRCEDLRRLDLESASVDVVLCHQVLHHVADQGAVLKELRRVLRRDGVMLVAESCRAFVRSLPVRMLFRHPPGGQHDAAGYQALLRENGFTFDANDTSTPDPFWSRPDFGLRERLGLRARARAEAAEVQVVARKAASDA